MTKTGQSVDTLGWHLDSITSIRRRIPNLQIVADIPISCSPLYCKYCIVLENKLSFEHVSLFRCLMVRSNESFVYNIIFIEQVNSSLKSL